MEKILVISSVITVFFCLSKIIEMKFIDKEWKPLKYVIRDAVIVFCSSLTCLFVFSQMNGTIQDFMSVVTNNKALNVSTTEVFTGEPGF